MADSDLRWLLVTGAPRSGTTMLRKVIAMHPGIALTHEYGLDKLVARIGALLDTDLSAGVQSGNAIHQSSDENIFYNIEELRTGYLDRELSGSPQNRKIEKDDKLLQREVLPAFNPSGDVGEYFYKTLRFYLDREEDLENTIHRMIPMGPDATGFSEMALAFYKIAFKKSDLQIVGDKKPMFADFSAIMSMKRVLPNLMYIIIVRDPIDVVSSSMRRKLTTEMKQDDWHITTLREACLEWYIAWKAAIVIKKSYPDHTMLVSYQDLCNDFEPERRRIFNFLSVEDQEISNFTKQLPGALQRRFLTESEKQTAEDFFRPILDLSSQIGLVKCLDEGLRCGHSYEIGSDIFFSDAESDKYVINGFSVAEPWGRWTDAREAILSFRVPFNSGDLDLKLKFLYFWDRPSDPLRFLVKINEGPAVMYDATGSKDIVIEIQNASYARDGVIEVAFGVFNPKAASEAPTDEGRALALGLESVCISSRTANSEQAV